MLDIVSCCLPCLGGGVPTLRINNRNFRILDLLGEGGFSYVYLVESQSDRGLFALKKIRCPYGNANLRQAIKEMENYKEFKSPYIIRAVDSSTVQESDGSKTVYILLPYYAGGSLQDVIDKNSVDNGTIEETEALKLFVGICRGLVSMHRHELSDGYAMRSSMDQASYNEATHPDEEDPFIADQDSTRQPSPAPTPPVGATELSETVSFAHRDLKPGNVMLSKDGTPVLCDLGSCDKARVEIENRSQAVTLQELANEQCTLAYRAPELLDIKVGDHLDEKVDIWSLGCTLYALLYGCSPFEREQVVNGANINLAIVSGAYSFPADPHYSDSIKGLITACLEVEPQLRPAIEDILSKALDLLQSARA